MEANELKLYLKTFLDSIKELEETDKIQLMENIRIKFFKKDEILVREGAFCNDCYFVLKGCLRKYELKEGKEYTSAFFMEHEAAVFFNPIKTQCPSSSFLVCSEDSILIIGNPEEEAKAYENMPKLAAITRKMMEMDLGKMQEQFSHFNQSNAEERYIHLLNTKPELFNRVPQHQIASYIGISPESLSRIRRKISGRS